MKRLNIFHINTERTFRGGEVQTLLLAKQLQKNGHNNFVFAQKNSMLAQKARDEAIQTVELAMRGEWDVYAAQKLRKAIRQNAPEILHAHTPHACALAILARGRSSSPLVVFSRRISSPLKRTAKYKQVDALIAVSPVIRRMLIQAGFEEGRIFLAESATDFAQLDQHTEREVMRESLGIPEQAFVIGNVGHFDRNKGQAKLIEAFSRLEDRYLLLLVGSGPELAHCRRLTKKIRAGNRIVFTGQRFDLGNIYNAMDLFFLPSSPTAFEGWSGVLREAMGMALPVIAVRQSATEEQIRHQETGMLVAPDALDDWASAMDFMFKNPDLRAKMGSEAKKFARQFTPELLAQKTEDCYREALRKSGG